MESKFKTALGNGILQLMQAEVYRLAVAAGWGSHAMMHANIGDVVTGRTPGDGCESCRAYVEWLTRLRDLLSEPLSCWEGEVAVRPLLARTFRENRMRRNALKTEGERLKDENVRLRAELDHWKRHANLLSEYLASPPEPAS